jgi:hypothetical protein
LYTLGQTPAEIANICTEAVAEAADGSKLKRAPMVSVLLAIARCLRNICSFCVNKSHMHTLAAHARIFDCIMLAKCKGAPENCPPKSQIERRRDTLVPTTRNETYT